MSTITTLEAPTLTDLEAKEAREKQAPTLTDLEAKEAQNIGIQGEHNTQNGIQNFGTQNNSGGTQNFGTQVNHADKSTTSQGTQVNNHGDNGTQHQPK